MAELGKKLGKLSLAILENFVEGTLGKKFVDELREPTDRAIAIDSALEHTEERFSKEFEKPDLAQKILTDVKQTSLGVLSDVIARFFAHPTDPDFQKAIRHIIKDNFPYLPDKVLDAARDKYIEILTEEFALADPDFRENVRGLTDLRMIQIMRRVEWLLASQHQKPLEAQFRTRTLHIQPPPADFTGREEIIKELLKDFESHKGATISGLTGMGGIGKTVLGLVVGQRIAENYPDGQIMIDLKGTTTPLSALDVIRQIILLLEPQMDVRGLDESNMVAFYQALLNGRKILLFLDNARSAEQIVPLRPPETCALLVTSRWNFAVAGLKTHKVGVLQEEEASAFLLELCPRIDKKAAELAKICGFLPLALRIAGSFLSVNTHWRVEKYLEELKTTKGRLETFAKSREGAGLSAEPDVLATFELSYNQLKDDEQKNWRALGVFPASFFGNAAAAVWGMGEEDASNLLALFLRYSLIDFNETSSRYEMHDLLAEYARSQMDGGEEEETRLKHASHYKDVLSAADDLYLAGNEKILTGLRLFDLEWENIRTGQAWTAKNVKKDHVSSELGVAYPDAGVYVLSLRQHPREKIQWLETSILAAREIGDRRGEGAALGNLGLAYAALGDARKAIEFYEQRMVIAREIGDRRGEGAALGNLGNAYADLGDARKAIEFYEQQLVIVREIGDRRGEGAALGNLGLAYAALGDARKAIEFYEQRMVIAREIGDRRGEGNALGNLGLAYADLGDKEKGIELVRQALIIFKAIESPNVQWARNKLKDWGVEE